MAPPNKHFFISFLFIVATMILSILAVAVNQEPQNYDQTTVADKANPLNFTPPSPVANPPTHQ
ncbi:hypothetical protein SLEP1_g34933 [Rubroshorea leprosula]|uniref:Transmembrane protein n=1 Tax=Rubroshorea leprosula TaxID=152421 RepID=A0AAV5KLL1_9ROSI|nr:hypothetical protein SLEP1_g34933 [Rubroshorea leprosula]